MSRQVTMSDVAEFFGKSMDWPFTQDEPARITRARIKRKNGEHVVGVILSRDDDYLGLFQWYAVDVPESRRLAMYEFMARVNYPRHVTTCQMGEQGGIGWRTVLFTKDSVFVPSQLRYALELLVSTADGYLPVVFSILYGNKSPMQALDDFAQEQKTFATGPAAASGGRREVAVVNSTIDLSEITADIASKSALGESQPPQLWMLMMDEPQARMLATEFAAPAESTFAASPVIINLPDGTAVVHFTLLHAEHIRQLVDTITNAVGVRCSGFTVHLPESDHSYVLQKISNLGEGIRVGDTLSFS